MQARVFNPGLQRRDLPSLDVTKPPYNADPTGVLDSTTAINQFFADLAIANRRCGRVSGRFKISGPIFIGAETGYASTLEFEGSMTLLASGPIETIVTVRGSRFIDWRGRLEVVGTGGILFASRTCRTGVHIVNGSRTSFGSVYVSNVWEDGIYLDSTAGNNNLVNLGNVRVYNCGSNRNTGKVTANWSGKVDSGGAGSIGQRSVVTVDALPPAGGVAHTTLAVIGGQAHLITAMDRFASTVTLYPWVDTTLSTGSLDYVFGAALSTFGGDSGIVNVDQLDALECGYAVSVGSLYGPVISGYVAQGCAVGISIGKGTVSAMWGMSITGLYSEINGFDLVMVTTAARNVALSALYETNLGKFQSIVGPRLADNSIAPLSGGIRGVRIDVDGYAYGYSKPPKNAQDTTSTLSLLYQPGATQVFRHNTSWTITLPSPSIATNSAFGYDSMSLVILGTAQGGAPTGTFTFNPPVGMTVNGTTTAVFDGFDGPASFVIYWRVGATDYEVRCLNASNRGVVPGSAIRGDVSATLTARTSERLQVWNSPLTTNRTATLSTTAALAGHTFRIVRTATSTGASTLDVGGLKALAPGQWCEVAYTGSAWDLIAFGSL